jgi:hypothetical protein
MQRQFLGGVLSLIPPTVLCLGLGIGFLRQRRAAIELRDRLVQLAVELKFGLAPHGDLLINGLSWLGILLVIDGFRLGAGSDSHTLAH